MNSSDPETVTTYAASTVAPGADTDALVAVICDLSLARSIAGIMSICTEAVRQLLHADGVTFILREGKDSYYAEENAIAPLWKGRRFPMGACISGWVMNERQPAIVPNVGNDPRIPQDVYQPTFVRSLAMVPVRHEDPIAALGAYWSRHHTLAPDRLALLQTVANAAALALAKVDMEAQRENARHAQMELDHRLKNVLAVIHAIAHLTMRRAANLDEFAQSFTGRLQALAAAQTQISRAGSAGTDLRTLIAEELTGGADDPRIALAGLDICLPADEAYHCGLAMHELGTNARKYGALSGDSGRVDIAWREHRRDDRRKLELTWSESGGPPVVAPTHRGFGSTLLAHAFTAGGGVETRYAADGFTCTITIDLGPSAAEPSPAE